MKNISCTFLLILTYISILAQNGSDCNNAVPLTVNPDNTCDVWGSVDKDGFPNTNVQPSDFGCNIPTNVFVNRDKEWWGVFDATSDVTAIIMDGTGGAEQMGMVIYEAPCGANMTAVACSGYSGRRNSGLSMGTLVLTTPGKTYYVRIVNIYPSSSAIDHPICVHEYPNFGDNIPSNCSDNIDFENGDFTNWRADTGHCCPIVMEGEGLVYTVLNDVFKYSGPDMSRHTITSGLSLDGYTECTVPITSPLSGNYSVRLGNRNLNSEAECLEQTFVVTPEYFGFTYMYAIVMEEPGHSEENQPRFMLEVTDANGDTIPCMQYSVVAGSGTGNWNLWETNPGGMANDVVVYQDWTAVGVDLTSYEGQQITVKFCSGDCGEGGHWAYAYFDAACRPLDLLGSTICTSGEPVELCAPPGYASWEWSNGASTECITVNNPSPGDIYTVTVTSVTGCISVITDTIEVLQGEAWADATICPGETITLGASANMTVDYAWTCDTDPNFISYDQNPDITPTQSGTNTYTVSITSDFIDCDLELDVIVNVLEDPNPTITGDIEICEGETTTLDAGAGFNSYSWIPSGSTQTISVNTTGDYSVTVTDANGCEGVDTITVTVSPGLEVNVTGTDLNCYQDNSGTVLATVNTGNQPFDYDWSNIAPINNVSSNTNSQSGLPEGTYDIIVTDANGCEGIGTVTITEPEELIISEVLASHKDVLCNGDNTGELEVSATGGTPDYMYSLDGGTQQATSVFTGLVVGSYQLEVEDANGCTDVITIEITEPPAIVLTSSIIESTCGTSDGTLTVTVTGGTPNYTYSIDNGVTTQNNGDFTGLVSGSYTILVEDNNGCTATISDDINNTGGPEISEVIASHIDVDCHGTNTGSIEVTAINGTPAYSFSFDGGAFQTNATFSNLGDGTYEVIVLDANSCPDTTTVTIVEPDTLIISEIITSHKDIKCFGDTDGELEVSATGGTPDYMYSLDGGVQQTSPLFTNLGVGTYTLEVEDANGCKDIITIEITAPPVLQTSIVGTDITCFGNADGSADLTVTGGTPDYTYSWGTEDVTDLDVGYSYVTVTDANGCTAIDSIEINQPDLLSLSIDNTSITGSGLCDATATVSPIGGTSPYTFLWDDPNTQTTQTAIDLCPGDYCVTVTDKNGCQDSICITISSLFLSSGGTDLLCYNVCDGTVWVTVDVGMPPYTYAWNDNNNSTTDTVYNLCAGTYTVTVTDNMGATDTAMVTITEPDQLGITLSGDSLQCYQSDDGQIQSVVTGGTPAYTYNWLHKESVTTYNTGNLTGLPAGNYNLTVTDANNCESIDSIEIYEPEDLNALLSPSHIPCYGDSLGNANLNVTGGTPPYTYLWNNTNASQNLINIPAGSYYVDITDFNNCFISDTVTVTEPEAITYTMTTQDINCHGESTGSIDIEVLGGTGSYTYSWNYNNQNTQDLNNIPAGTYILTINDSNGCDIIIDTTLTEPTDFDITYTTTDVDCYGYSTGGINLTVTGATPTYTYNWTNSIPAVVGNTANLTGIPADTYNVLVTDANGCFEIVTGIEITEPSGMASSIIPTDVLCFGEETGEIDLTVTGGAGSYSYLWNYNNAISEDLTSIPAGDYTVIITDANDCEITDNITINQPNTALELTLDATDILCYGDQNGKVIANVTGGTPNYTYLWSNGFNGSNNINLIAGNYSLTVTDANKCTVNALDIVVQPDPLSISITPSQHVCIDEPANIVANVTGGTPQYTYSWNYPGNTAGISVSIHQTASVSVTVTDANDCPISAETKVYVLDSLHLSLNILDDVICINEEAVINAIAGGGMGEPYTFTYNSDTVIFPFSDYPQQTTTYKVCVEDNCTTPEVCDDVTVNVIPLPNIMATPDQGDGCQPHTVNFTLFGEIDKIENYVWDFGDNVNLSLAQNPTHVYDNYGIFDVSINIVDTFGCANTIVYPSMIEVYRKPIADFIARPSVASILDPEIEFDNLSQYEDSNYWYFGDSDSSIFYEPVHVYNNIGSYDVMLVANTEKNCKDTIIRTVVIEDAYTFYAPTAFSPDGDGKNDLFFVTGSGIDPTNFKLYIFDRWGEPIFSTSVFDQGTKRSEPWDGRVKEKSIASMGSYTWLVIYRDVEGLIHEEAGSVTVIK